MAIRKWSGFGNSEWETLCRWEWWVGILCDTIAGLLIWPAMPYISVNVLMPFIIVVHLTVATFLGLVWFREPASVWSITGIFCAVFGVIGLSLTNTFPAAEFSVEEFWEHWVRLPFLCSFGACIFIVVISFFVAHMASFWAMASGIAEAIQFICSRAIVDTALTDSFADLVKPAALGAGAIKFGGIVAILFFQHYGFQSDFSRFTAIYLASGTLFCCVMGTMYFGDDLVLSGAFFASAVSTFLGIFLLNAAVHQNKPDHDGDADDDLPVK